VDYLIALFFAKTNTGRAASCRIMEKAINAGIDTSYRKPITVFPRR